MANYGERLNDLLFERKISPEKLSEDLSVSLSTVYRWKNNEADFFLSNLIALADYFRCSADLILCRSEDYSDYPPKQCPPFSQRLRAVMREKGMSTYKLRKNTRYDGKYFNNWDKGADPLASTLIELAAILDCSVDYLLGRE
ncbi:MAG: helix-turn-helix domain-containing protein [Firmicutes bacterium]|nr:helix-turn-helix domain-containing protein [Bacillota bacterium]